MNALGKGSGFWEVSFGQFWTMFGALHLFKVEGLLPPTPPGTYTFTLAKVFLLIFTLRHLRFGVVS